MTAATSGSPKVSPEALSELVGRHDYRASSVAEEDELEDQVGSFHVERDVVPLVDDDQGRSLQLAAMAAISAHNSWCCSTIPR